MQCSIKILYIISVLFMFSCNDSLLKRCLQSSLSPQTFFTSESELKSYSNSFYNIVSTLANGSFSSLDQGRNNAIGKPNVILILAESHRAEALGIMGNTFVQTPNLNQLASEGTLFNNAYVTTSICVVSRASILSGQHRARHGINAFGTSFTQSAFNSTLPMVLRDAGYKLAWIGSYGVGTPPLKSAFDYWNSSVPWTFNGEHNTDNVLRQATIWLQSYDKKEEPFYMQLNFSAAHEIDPSGGKPAYYMVQERHKSLYGGIQIPVPTSSDSSVWNSFPDFFRTNSNIARSRWYGFFDTAELMQKNSKDYYRLITGVDEAVGALRAKLEALDLDENTIVIYTTDHGFSLGEHGIMGKWFPFDNSIHVPLLIYNPLESGLAKKEVSSIALNIDIAPTILNMVDVDVPQRMQGVNLVDLVKGNIAERNQFFYEHTLFGTPQLPAVEAVVSKELKYIKFIEHNYEMLYDLKTDPDEIYNLVDNPAYSEKLNQMRSLYTSERAAAR